jgi:hypothetical protein
MDRELSKQIVYFKLFQALGLIYLSKGYFKTGTNSTVPPRVSSIGTSNNLILPLINTGSMQALLQDSFYFNCVIIQQ